MSGVPETLPGQPQQPPYYDMGGAGATPPPGTQQGMPQQPYGMDPQQQQFEAGMPSQQPQQQYPFYPPPQGIPVMIPIPSSNLMGSFRGPLRMRLMSSYPTLTRYKPTPQEAAVLTAHSAKGWLSLVTDFVVPLMVWVRTAPPMNEEAIQLRSGGDEKRADTLRKVYGRSLGWRTPNRIAATLGTFMGLKLFNGFEDEWLFKSFLDMQSPMGTYARYLTSEGDRAASLGVSNIAHPPIPLPAPQPQFQQPFNSQQQQQQQQQQQYPQPNPTSSPTSTGGF